MGWLASFKGLKGLGVPPILAAAAIVALFLFVRRGDNAESDSQTTTA
ncbi:MAG: hypothetical protein HKN91_11205 [Acidimicrobiia bacterium]|nr:hypothetical protein [Acidimicrobiia bacterium]